MNSELGFQKEQASAASNPNTPDRNPTDMLAGAAGSPEGNDSPERQLVKLQAELASLEAIMIQETPLLDTNLASTEEMNALKALHNRNTNRREQLRDMIQTLQKTISGNHNL